MASVFLLPPWAGFDEPYHHGYAESNAERLAWPKFREIGLPDRLVGEIRRWPMPGSYAGAFSAREYGRSGPVTVREFRDTNYETQQSPLYYWMAGGILRAIPRISPTGRMYVLRSVNAALAFGIGLFLWKAASRTRWSWVPVALLALIPGFGIDLCRVGNDALCAALMSAALAGALVRGGGGRSATAASLAGGLAPWAKLYGLALLPCLAIRELLRKGAAWPSRIGRVLLLTIPSIALAICSWKILATPLPIQYNVRHAPAARLVDVPWLHDAWAVAKSQIWTGGMTFLVFPTGLYVAVVLWLGWGLLLTFRSRRESDRLALSILAAAAACFSAALAYNAWRTYSFFHGGGATGGWYVWGLALPELILATEGARRRAMMRSWILPALCAFLVLTVLADVAMFFESTGLLLESSRHHVMGVRLAPLATILATYLTSRPAAAAIAALCFAGVSWLCAAVLLILGWRQRLRSEGPGGCLGSLPDPISQDCLP